MRHKEPDDIVQHLMKLGELKAKSLCTQAELAEALQIARFLGDKCGRIANKREEDSCVSALQTVVLLQEGMVRALATATAQVQSTVQQAEAALEELSA